MKTFLSLILVLISAKAFATIESEAQVQIPYSPAQAQMDFEYMANNWGDEYATPKMYCMAPYLYYDHYSSSALPSYEIMMQPYNIPSYPSSYGPVQINSLADGIIKVETNWDDFDNYVSLDPNDWQSPTVHEPKFVVDVSGYDQSQPAGRLQAITMAKLAIVSLYFNLGYYGSLFRLTVEVKGLPSNQQEFTNAKFTQVYAKTMYPYSGKSPVAQRYVDELISEDFCKKDYDQAKAIAK